MVAGTPAKRAELSDGACTGWVGSSIEYSRGPDVGWERFSATGRTGWRRQGFCSGAVMVLGRTERTRNTRTGVVYTRSRLKQWCQTVTAKSRHELSLAQTHPRTPQVEAEDGPTERLTASSTTFQNVDAGVGCTFILVLERLQLLSSLVSLALLTLWTNTCGCVSPAKLLIWGEAR